MYLCSTEKVLGMPRKPIIDYKRYYVFKNGFAYCVVPGCARPEWGYSMRDKHPAEYAEVCLVEQCTFLWGVLIR